MPRTRRRKHLTLVALGVLLKHISTRFIHLQTKIVTAHNAQSPTLRTNISSPCKQVKGLEKPMLFINRLRGKNCNRGTTKQKKTTRESGSTLAKRSQHLWVSHVLWKCVYRNVLLLCVDVRWCSEQRYYCNRSNWAMSDWQKTQFGQHCTWRPKSKRTWKTHEKKKMLLDVVIELAQTEWADSPLHFCVGHRRITALTKSDVYPVPCEDKIIGWLGVVAFFSAQDADSINWHLRIETKLSQDGLYRTART